jgi:hypothetical protein
MRRVGYEAVQAGTYVLDYMASHSRRYLQINETEGTFKDWVPDTNLQYGDLVKVAQSVQRLSYVLDGPGFEFH